MPTVPPSFESLDEILDAASPQAALDHLIAQFREAKEYSLAFEATLMMRRRQYGLPLIQTAEIDHPEYQKSVVEAAREAGALFLADGRIERAWPYFRAIGESDAVREAIDRAAPGENADQIASIAFQEGIHPRKGLELILQHHGMCRAITAFGMTSVTKDRAPCIALLATHIHDEIVTRLGGAIEAREGSAPAAANIAQLIGDHDWLFGEWDYYVDTSHLLSVLPYCTELADPATLNLFADLCAYGQKLAPQFHQAGIPPFEDQFTAYGHYIQALLGHDVESHLDYFREKTASADSEVAGDAPARVLAKLLIATGRIDEALKIVRNDVFEDAPYGIPVPGALQLCYIANDFQALKDLARERGDLLSYAAGAILAREA